ncbi:putative bacitracin resistance protein [gamma proteobacterium HIMB55]|nr:putative bacitracin resistance protein [gamma proteobacterium HIMB55]
MDTLQVVILALIQGLTEFLPVSSSAHLILPSQLLGWSDQGLAFDVAVHAGTLIAVLVYYRGTLRTLLSGAFGRREATRAHLSGGPDSDLRDDPVALDTAATNKTTISMLSAWREIACLVVATIPVMLIGLLFATVIDIHFRGLNTIAYATLGFGLLLGVAYRFRGSDGEEQSITRLDHALLIGMAQALALIPGTSRSGVTITAASFLGYNIATSARFSFLLSIPVIGGALILMLVTQSDAIAGDAIFEILAAMMIAGLSAYLTIAFFVGLVKRIGMMPFVVYRVLLAALLLAII